MTNFDIRISISKISQYSISSEYSKYERVLLQMIESFAYYVKDLYIAMIEESIHSRRYKGKWEPIEEKGYLDYLGVTPSVEIIHLIKDAIEVKKSGYYFVVRINPHYKYPGTDLYLVKVLRAIENGTSDFNARPILYKNAQQIRDNIFDLWRGYLTMKGVI